MSSRADRGSSAAQQAGVDWVECDALAVLRLERAMASAMRAPSRYVRSPVMVEARRHSPAIERPGSTHELDQCHPADKTVSFPDSLVVSV